MGLLLGGGDYVRSVWGCCWQDAGLERQVEVPGILQDPGHFTQNLLEHKSSDP